jgi:hypothetical protein
MAPRSSEGPRQLHEAVPSRKDCPHCGTRCAELPSPLSSGAADRTWRAGGPDASDLEVDDGVPVRPMDRVITWLLNWARLRGRSSSPNRITGGSTPHRRGLVLDVGFRWLRVRGDLMCSGLPVLPGNGGLGAIRPVSWRSCAGHLVPGGRWPRCGGIDLNDRREVRAPRSAELTNTPVATTRRTSRRRWLWCWRRRRPAHQRRSPRTYLSDQGLPRPSTRCPAPSMRVVPGLDSMKQGATPPIAHDGVTTRGRTDLHLDACAWALRPHCQPRRPVPASGPAPPAGALMGDVRSRSSTSILSGARQLGGTSRSRRSCLRPLKRRVDQAKAATSCPASRRQHGPLQNRPPACGRPKMAIARRSSWTSSLPASNATSARRC